MRVFYSLVRFSREGLEARVIGRGICERIGMVRERCSGGDAGTHSGSLRRGCLSRAAARGQGGQTEGSHGDGGLCIT